MKDSNKLSQLGSKQPPRRPEPSAEGCRGADEKVKGGDGQKNVSGGHSSMCKGPVRGEMGVHGRKGDAEVGNPRAEPPSGEGPERPA